MHPPKGEKANITLVAAKKKNVQLDDKGTKHNTPDNQVKEAAPAEGGNTAPKAKLVKASVTAFIPFRVKMVIFDDELLTTSFSETRLGFNRVETGYAPSPTRVHPTQIAGH